MVRGTTLPGKTVASTIVAVKLLSIPFHGLKWAYICAVDLGVPKRMWDSSPYVAAKGLTPILTRTGANRRTPRRTKALFLGRFRLWVRNPGEQWQTRRAGFRIMCRQASGFESRLPNQAAQRCRGPFVVTLFRELLAGWHYYR